MLQKNTALWQTSSNRRSRLRRQRRRRRQWLHCRGTHRQHGMEQHGGSKQSHSQTIVEIDPQIKIKKSSKTRKKNGQCVGQCSSRTKKEQSMQTCMHAYDCWYLMYPSHALGRTNRSYAENINQDTTIARMINKKTGQTSRLFSTGRAV